MKTLLCLSLVLPLLFGSQTLRAEVIRVNSVKGFREALPTLKAGDELLLEDGEYRDSGLLYFNSSGTPQAPIRIRPVNPHQVRFSGELRWHLQGSYTRFEGLIFDRVKKLQSPKKYDSLISSPFSSRGLQFLGCHFLHCESALREDNSVQGSILTLRGDLHRVQGCVVIDPLATFLSLNGDEAQMQKRIRGNLRVEGNLFRDTSRLRKLEGQGEIFFMGRGFSHYRTQPLGAHIEGNVFDRCIGDTHGEIITIKSSDNVFLRNVFANGPGAWFEGGAHLSLRHTDNCIIRNNVFHNLGCGIWVTGRNHRIEQNLFQHIDFAALYFPAGNILEVEDDRALIMIGGERIDPNQKDIYPYIAREYGAVFWPAQQNSIQHNLFSDLRKFAIYSRIPPKEKTKHGSLPPTGNRISNNLFHFPASSEAVPHFHIDQPEQNRMQGNLIAGQPSGSVQKSGEGMQQSAAIPPNWIQARSALLASLPSIPPMPGSLQQKPLKAEFHPFQAEIQQKQFLVLDAAFSSGDIRRYAWDFGDGNSHTVQQNAVSHRWSRAGEYRVQLTVTDAQGRQQKSHHLIRVLP